MKDEDEERMKERERDQTRGVHVKLQFCCILSVAFYSSFYALKIGCVLVAFIR